MTICADFPFSLYAFQRSCSNQKQELTSPDLCAHPLMLTVLQASTACLCRRAAAAAARCADAAAAATQHSSSLHAAGSGTRDRHGAVVWQEFGEL